MNRFKNFIAKSVVIKIPVWVFLSLPFFAYLGWEYYWYKQVGLGFIKWHTHVAVYIYLWLAGAIGFFILLQKRPSEKVNKRFLIFSSIILALLLVEIIFHLSGNNKTQTEKDSGLYKSPYIPSDKTYYHLWPVTAKEHQLTKPEYSYWRPTNSTGLPDYQWSISRKGNEKRILALGDSFTEGDGAPYDSSYVSLLKEKLLAGGDTFNVMNAGVCGSDPFNNYIVLRDCLLVYKPDIIIQAIGTNDLNTDIIARGGMERFQKDGTMKYQAAPWWEPLYAISYLSRVFYKMAGYNELLVKDKLKPEEKDKINSETIDLFKQYSALCRQEHIRLVVVLRPDKYEVIANQYSYDFSVLLNHFKTDTLVRVIDLLPSYRRYIENKHSNPLQYYWVIDGHHNSAGYEMMAQTIYENLPEVIPDLLPKNEK